MTIIMPNHFRLLHSFLQRTFCVLFSATMAWVVGMADEENQDDKASGRKKRKKQKPSRCELNDAVLC